MQMQMQAEYTGAKSEFDHTNRACDTRAVEPARVVVALVVATIPTT